MMKYCVDMSVRAEQDLARAAEYIGNVLKNPIAVRRLLRSADEAIDALEEHPQRTPVVRDSFLSSMGVRMLKVQNYALFYRIDEAEKSVLILRFLYGNSDWAAALGSKLSEE